MHRIQHLPTPCFVSLAAAWNRLSNMMVITLHTSCQILWWKWSRQHRLAPIKGTQLQAVTQAERRALGRLQSKTECIIQWPYMGVIWNWTPEPQNGLKWREKAWLSGGEGAQTVCWLDLLIAMVSSPHVRSQDLHIHYSALPTMLMSPLELPLHPSFERSFSTMTTQKGT